jgi:CBS domain-containing protein
MRVHEAMRTTPVTVEPDMTVAEARALAESQGVRHLVVTVGRRVLGVVEEDGLWLSAEDVLRTTAGLQGSLTARETRSVRSAMHPANPVVSPNESLATAARVMLLKRRTAVPVLDSGKLVGVLTVDECRKAVGAPLMAVPGPEVQEDASNAEVESADGESADSDVA